MVSQQLEMAAHHWFLHENEVAGSYVCIRVESVIYAQRTSTNMFKGWLSIINLIIMMIIIMEGMKLQYCHHRGMSIHRRTLWPMIFEGNLVIIVIAG